MPTGPDEQRAPGIRPLLPLTRADLVALAVFVLLPLGMFGLPALFGHLIAPGDDLNQNLPLRMLSGSFINAGKLPLWDPLIWSGTPLLSGWNAGALFPGTLLFAFLPASTAWTLNLAFAPAGAAIGLYLLLRRFSIRPIAAWFGGAIFAYTGFMAGQIVHIGLIQGTAFMPWLLLALDMLFRPRCAPSKADPPPDPPTGAAPHVGTNLAAELRERSTLIWVLVLAVATAATVLAGDPRAVSTSAVVALVYLIALLSRAGSRRAHGLVATAGGVLLGTMLCAIQLLPGISFLRASQRGTTALSFFGAGSLSAPKIVTNLLVPFGLGGNGNFGLPVYSGSYNLPEITIGAGLISLVGVFAFVPEVATAVWARARGHRHRVVDPRRQLGVWFMLLLIGTVLTLGTATPIGQLLVHIPFYGSERLQNRNAAIMDFALAAIAGLFVDEWLNSVRNAQHSSIRRRPARVLGSIPCLLAIGLAVMDLVDSSMFGRLSQEGSQYGSTGLRLAGYLVPFAIGAVVLCLAWVAFEHLSPRARLAAVSFAMAADVGLFIVNAGYGTAPTSLFSGQSTLSAQVRRLLGGEGRFAMYDPSFAVFGSNSPVADAAGLPDVNVAQTNPSIQGYGSIVNSVYQNVTGSHLLVHLKASVLSSEAANTLDLRLLLTPSVYLASPLRPHQPVPLPQALGGTTTSPFPTSGPWMVKPGASVTWQLPQALGLRRATFLINAGNLPNKPLAVTLYHGPRVTERTGFAPTKNTNIVTLDALKSTTSVALTNTLDVPVDIAAVTIVTSSPGRRYVLDGALQGHLQSPRWVFVGRIGPYAAFKNTEIRGLAWLQPTRAHTPDTRAIARGRVIVYRGAATDTQVMRVRNPTTAILARSEAYAAGWYVTIASAGGPSRTVTQKVHRFGLIQEVVLPPGDWTVTWRYRPHSIERSLIVSGVGLALLIVGIAVALWRARSIRQPRRPMTRPLR